MLPHLCSVKILTKDESQLSGRPDGIDELSKVYGWVPGQIYPKPNKISLNPKIISPWPFDLPANQHSRFGHCGPNRLC